MTHHNFIAQVIKDQFLNTSEDLPIAEAEIFINAMTSGEIKRLFGNKFEQWERYEFFVYYGHFIFFYAKSIFIPWLH